jgi:DNA-binding NtrC family response regulator
LDILLVEDETTIAVTLGDDLRAAGHHVDLAVSGPEAMDRLKTRVYDVVITDVRLPDGNGIEILKTAREHRPTCEVIVMTGYATVDQAVEAMKLGAYHYFQKPFLNEAVLEVVARIQRYHALWNENQSLKQEREQRDELSEIIGQSRKMQDLFKRIHTVARSDVSALILGESGTGKERIARAIHRLSPRRDGPFVAVSCGALPATVLESELFGHERGAFTDAVKQRKGRFELAAGGTIFLDDIDDMPIETQVKLLRVLQEREFERIGGESTIKVDLRVVSATKVPLEKLVPEGRFREDLYYRLKVVVLVLPPLREREGDIALLVRHFIKRFGSGKEYQVKPEVLEAMERYSWPGNVRELENHVAGAVALAGQSTWLRKEDLLPVDRERRAALAPALEDMRPLGQVMQETEREHLRRVLRAVGGHRTKAAQVLGISRKVLWEKLRDYGIEDE